MTDQYLEAIENLLDDSDECRQLVWDIVEAWVGDRELYRIERCEHDTDKHFNAIVMGGHFVGRLEEHLPSCAGSRLVPVSVTEGEPT